MNLSQSFTIITIVIVISISVIILLLTKCVSKGGIDDNNPFSVFVKKQIMKIITKVSDKTEAQIEDTIAEQVTIKDQLDDLETTFNEVKVQEQVKTNLNKVSQNEVSQNEVEVQEQIKTNFNEDTRNEVSQNEVSNLISPNEVEVQEQIKTNFNEDTRNEVSPNEVSPNEVSQNEVSQNEVSNLISPNEVKNIVSPDEVLEGFDTNFNYKLPTSGSEPMYNEMEWNDPSFVKTNNCYAYFLNDKKFREKKPQPGYFSGNDKPNTYKSCNETEKRVVQDNPNVYMSSETKPCKKGYYKGYLAIDPGKDYHFYRQDTDGFWSHKPGGLSVTNLDSDGNEITNPREASKIYDNYQYTMNCNYFCVPENGYKTTNAK